MEFSRKVRKLKKCHNITAWDDNPTNEIEGKPLLTSSADVGFEGRDKIKYGKDKRSKEDKKQYSVRKRKIGRTKQKMEKNI